jgi:hypothetical protein
MPAPAGGRATDSPWVGAGPSARPQGRAAGDFSLSYCRIFLINISVNIKRCRRLILTPAARRRRQQAHEGVTRTVGQPTMIVGTMTRREAAAAYAETLKQ